MKKIKILLTIGIIIILLPSCSKLENLNGALLPIAIDSAQAQIGIIQDNLQTKYGNFSQSYHVEANLPSAVGVTNLVVNGVQIPKDLSNTFYLSSDNAANTTLASNIATFTGNSLIPISLNGINLSSTLSLPYAKIVTNDLSSWQISKNKGITLNFASVNYNNAFSTSAFTMPDASSLITVVAIAPSNLSNSNATSKYWVIDNNSSSVTIQPNDLADYAVNENIDIAIGSGVINKQTIKGNSLNIFSMNITHLPELTIQ